MSQPVAAREPVPADGQAAVAPSRWQGENGSGRGASSSGRSPFPPLFIFLGAAVAWSGFQFYQLQLENSTLSTLRANQDAQLQQAQRVRATLDTMALETQKLADTGNASARLVVEELRRRGITINRPPAPAAGK